MSQFSSFRVGNFVTCFKGAGCYQIARITEIHIDEYAIQLQNGEVLRCGVFEHYQKYPYIAGVTLNPAALGFSKIGDREYSDGLIDLVDIAELEDDGLIEEDESQHYINRFEKIGFSVRRVDDHSVLVTEEWDDEEEKYVGICELHELQNMYSDFLPDQSVKLVGMPV